MGVFEKTEVSEKSNTTGEGNIALSQEAFERGGKSVHELLAANEQMIQNIFRSARDSFANVPETVKEAIREGLTAAQLKDPLYAALFGGATH